MKRARRRIRLFRLKGVSAVIAVLLMIAIAVIAALIAYFWVMGYFRTTSSKVSKAIQIPSAYYTGRFLCVYVQNVGQGKATLAGDQCLYVDGRLQGLAQVNPGGLQEASYTLQESETAIIVDQINLTLGQTIKIKVVTTEGTFVEKYLTINNFAGQNPYSLTVIVSPPAGGSVTFNNTGPYYYGDVVQLTSVVTPGWSFSSWSQDLSGSANPTTIVINGVKAVTAIFVQNTYTVTENIVGQGSILRNASQPYVYGQAVNFTATSMAGWSFSAWGGDLSGSASPATLIMNANKTVTATFTQNTYTLTMHTVGEGSVLPGNGTYLSGTSVDIKAIETAGWTFEGWSGGASGKINATVVMNGDTEVTATFGQNTYMITINIVGQGTVNRNATEPYVYGQAVDLTAVPQTGWSLQAWSGDLTGSNSPETIIMDANKTVTATFTQDTYTITIDIVGQGTVEMNATEPYTYGQVVNLTATPNSGWTFIGWSQDLISPDNPATLMIDANKTVTATFSQNTYTIAINIVGQGVVDRNATEPYVYGQAVNLTAIPQVGWSFSAWSDDLAGVTSNPAALTMDANKTVTATFTQNTYTIVVTVVGSGEVQRNATEPYVYGQAVNLTAVPTGGWTFQGWGGDLAGVTSNPATVIMTGNKAVTATFSQGIPGTIIFFDDFNDGSIDPPWTTSGWTDTSNYGPAYPGADDYAMLIGFGASITVNINTTDFSGVQLSYWRVNDPWFGTPNIRVEWRVGTSESWTTIEEYEWDNWAQNTFAFPTRADDQNIIQIRFAIVNTILDGAYVDDVLVTGTPLPPHAHVTFTQTGSVLPINVNYQIGSGGSGTVDVPFTVIVPVGEQIDYTYLAEVLDTGTKYVLTGVNATNPLIVTNTNPVTVTGSYKTQYRLTLATNPSGVGVSHITALPSSPDGFYDSGTGVSLTADSFVTINATSRYRFTGWSGDAGGTSNTTSVTMSAVRSVTANYVIQHQVSFAVNPVGTGTTNATGYYDAGSISIRASANAGYVFSSWTPSGSISIPNPTANPTTATVSGTGTITANFVVTPVLDHFDFDTISSPKTAGTAFTITIRAKDQNNNTFTSYTSTNSLNVSTGTISPTTTTAFTAGVWTGSVTLYTTGTGITIGTTGATKTGISNGITVNAGSGEFGYHTQGSSSYNGDLENYILGSIYTSPAYSVTAQSITAYIQVGGTHTIKAAIYTLSGSTGTLVRETQEVSVTTSNDGWVTFAFASGNQPTLTANTDYLLVVWANSASGSADLYYTSSGGAGRYNSETYTTHYPSPTTFSSSTVGSYRYSIYCTYSIP